jgi:transglutaminase-like putative cysteine protease
MILTRIVRWMGVRTLLALLLLLAAFASVVMGLVEVSTGLEATPLMVTAVIALLFGWLLAKSPLPGWLAGSVALIIGVEAALIRYGRLGDRLLELPGALFRLVLEVWLWPLGRPPDPSPILHRLEELAASAAQAINQFWAWLLALVQGEPVFDPWAVALAWSLGLWGLALWASWAVRRHHRPLAAVAPAGAVVAGVLSYSRGNPAALYTLLLSAVPLLGLIGYDASLRRWQREQVDYPEDITIDLSFVLVGLTIALTTAALLAPSLSVRQIARSVRRLLEGPAEGTDRIAESFGISQGGGLSAPLDAWQESSLPRFHLIGSGPELEEQAVMAVKTSPSPTALPQRLYWRSLTFDSYTGAGWTNGPTERITYKTGQLASDVPPFPHQIVHQEIQSTAKTAGLLYAAGTPMTADHDFGIAWRALPNSETSAEGDLFGATIRSGSYRVVSWIPTPTEAQLQAAGDDYPQWVRDRYVALPPSLPSRVVTLTHQLIEGTTTPYERAIAIESYLRTFTYTLDLPEPPAGRDMVEYFLFDLKKGYCDYYATAMVVMARAAGLPARLVVGYASGTYHIASDRSFVTEADAHSWVDVYFPDYGWIEFEPTAGRSALARPDELPLPEIPEEWQAIQEGRGFSGLLSSARRLWWLSGVLGALVVAGWELIDHWRLRRLSPSAAGVTLYQRVLRHGRRLRVPAKAGDTPHEFATSFVERIAVLATGRRWSEAIIAAIGHVHWLTDFYVRTVYSPHAPDTVARTQAIEAWHRLRWRLWLGRFWQWGRGRRRRTPARQNEVANDR